MGNTRRSFGQHLHFELHKGRWNLSKSNAVDPLKYLTSNVSHNNTRIKTIQRTLNNRYNTKLKVNGLPGSKTNRALIKLN